MEREAVRAIATALLPQINECVRNDNTVMILNATGDDDAVIDKVLEIIKTRLNCTARKQLILLLKLLNTRMGSLLIIRGKALSFKGGISAFTQLPLNERVAILQSWSNHKNEDLRKGFKGLKGLICSSILTVHQELLQCLDYYPPSASLPPPTSPAVQAEQLIAANLIDVASASNEGGVDAVMASLAAKGLIVHAPHNNNSTSTAAADDDDAAWTAMIARKKPDIVVQGSFDALIIGSGAGGGPMAAQLSNAGIKVLVLEKSGFVPMQEMTLKEGEAYEKMYEAAGTVLTENGAMTVLAGSCLGGGTRINWSASFQTPPHVKKEWAEQHGLVQFESEEYTNALNTVCDRLGVRTGFKHGKMCSTLKVGLEELGVKNGDVPRNCTGVDVCSGHCCFGCVFGQKKDTVNTWLADACRGRGGCRIVTGAYVDEILCCATQDQTKKKKVLGVLAEITIMGSNSAPCCPASTKKITLAFRAPLVVSSAGSLHTPAIFLRSGIKRNVGSNLRLHPCTCIVGVFDDAIKGFEGPSMSVYSSELGDWEGGGYGALLFNPALHPALFAAAAPWIDGENFKELLLQYKNACVVLVLVRDKSSGRVFVDKEGAPRVDYKIGASDKQNMLKGMKLGMESMAAAGASSVIALLNTKDARYDFGSVAAAEKTTSTTLQGSGKVDENNNVSSAHYNHLQDGQEKAQFDTWMNNVLDMAEKNPAMPTFSAHQMGTARLGVDPSTSVLDANGESWECSGLYCADGSVFPTPTGVNPMITISSIAYMLGGRLASRLAAENSTKTRRQHVDIGNGDSLPPPPGMVAKL